MICYVLAMGKQQLGPQVVVGYGRFITSPDHPDLLSYFWPITLKGYPDKYENRESITSGAVHFI